MELRDAPATAWMRSGHGEKERMVGMRVDVVLWMWGEEMEVAAVVGDEEKILGFWD